MAVDGTGAVYLSALADPPTSSSSVPDISKLASPATGTPQLRFGTSGPGTLNAPQALAFGPDGLLYVLDTGDQRVVSFDSDGNYRNAFPLAGAAEASALAIDPAGRLYTADGNGGVGVYDIYTGAYLGSVTALAGVVPGDPSLGRISLLVSGDYLYLYEPDLSVHVFFLPPATHFAVSAPATAAAGAPFSVTVTARDQYDNVATGYRGTVHFTTTDPGAGVVLPANYTFVPADNGVHTFTGAVTLASPGGRTVTATDTASPSITGVSAAITVNAAAATHFTVAAPASAIAGSPFAFTVTALDQFNNVATGYTGTVQFTKTDAGADSAVPANYTFAPADNGVKVFAAGATLVTPGNGTLTATDTANAAITGTSNTILVNAAAATHLTVAAPASAVAGSPFAFTVTALDQFNNVATGHTGTVQFTKTDPGAGSAVPANYTFVAGDNGVKVFAAGATLVTPGNQTLTATDTASAAITGTSNAILVGTAAATHFTVAAPASAVAGTAFNVTVTALDQFNNTVTGYAGTVHFTSTDAVATLPANATLTNGIRVFSATLKTAGNRTLTVTDTVAPAITGTSQAITVTAVTTVSGQSATGTGMITAVLTGGPGCTFASAQFIAVSGDPGSPPAGSAPAGVTFPHGLFDFSTTGCTPASTITVTITYPSALPPGTQYWKYGPRPGPIAAGWYVLPATVVGNTITFSIGDGQLGDDDLLANGAIVDQGGPGSPVAIPTLGEWGMLLLALSLLVLGVGALRFRHTSR